MRTSTPLGYASPPSVRKAGSKRRRLSYGVDQPASRALADNSNLAPTHSLCAKLSCSSCHRAVRLGVAGLICSRCSAPTCAICARTCTSYTCPSSNPPTPALTRSPSPANTPVSPKRVALGLSYAAMNGDISAALAPLSVKRKKAPIDKEDVADGDVDGRDRCDATSAYGGASDSIVIPGCGRVVCRACCVESIPNDGKLCIECFARV